MKCICGCLQQLHQNYSDACMNWHEDGCMSFVPDDGSSPGTLSVDHRADQYQGIYGTERRFQL